MTETLNVAVVTRAPGPMALMVIFASVFVGCEGNSALERLSDARHISSDLLVHFTNAADAANRSVMADTDEASIVCARPTAPSKPFRPTSMHCGHSFRL